MKKKLPLAFAFTLAFVLGTTFKQTAKAQVPYYAFSQTTSTYTDLTAPVSINNSAVWDVTVSGYYSLSMLGLINNFNLFGDINYDMRIYGGAIQFYNTSSQQIYYINGLNFVSPDYMRDKGYGTGTSLSPISYQVSGSAPNRILKVQWKNAGHVAFASDAMNVQFWIYETSNNIEFHYGSSTITNASSTQLSIGLGHTYYANSNVVEDDFLQNSPSNPVLVSPSGSAFLGIPANGAVYRFSRNNVGIDELANPLAAIQITPNPSDGNFFIHTDKINPSSSALVVKVTSILGETVLEKSLNTEAANQLDLTNQKAGVYFVKIYNETNSFNQRIVIR